MGSPLLVVSLVFAFEGVAACCPASSVEKPAARVSTGWGELIESAGGWRVESIELRADWDPQLKPGDLIRQVDEEDASTLGPLAVASLLGEMGERDIRLKVQRGDGTMELRIPIAQEWKPRDGVWFQPVPPGASEKAHLQRRGALAPDFRLPDVEGKTVSLSGLRGHWVLLDFWSISCGPCRREMPLLSKLATELASRMVVLGVAQEDKLEEVRKYLATSPLGFRVLLGGGSGKNPALRAYDFERVPVNILVTPDGSVAYVTGPIRNDHLIRGFVLH